MSRRLCAVRLTNATYLDLWLETAAQHRINHFSNCFKIKMHPLKKGAELASGRRQTRCTTRQSAHAQIEILSPENLLPKHSTKQISCLKKTADKRHQKANSTGNLCYSWPILFTSCMSITPFTAKSKAMLPSISMENHPRKHAGRTRDHSNQADLTHTMKKISNTIPIKKLQDTTRMRLYPFRRTIRHNFLQTQCRAIKNANNKIEKQSKKAPRCTWRIYTTPRPTAISIAGRPQTDPIWL